MVPARQPFVGPTTKVKNVHTRFEVEDELSSFGAGLLPSGKFGDGQSLDVLVDLKLGGPGDIIES